MNWHHSSMHPPDFFSKYDSSLFRFISGINEVPQGRKNKILSTFTFTSNYVSLLFLQLPSLFPFVTGRRGLSASKRITNTPKALRTGRSTIESWIICWPYLLPSTVIRFGTIASLCLCYVLRTFFTSFCFSFIFFFFLLLLLFLTSNTKIKAREWINYVSLFTILMFYSLLFFCFFVFLFKYLYFSIHSCTVER